jgi:hypothetical protein
MPAVEAGSRIYARGRPRTRDQDGDRSPAIRFPAWARERGHVVDILGDDVPVHHGLGFRTGHRIGDIGATHCERGTEDDSEKQAHVVLLPPGLVGLRQSMIRKACGFANEIKRANKCLKRRRDSSGSDAALGDERGAIVLWGVGDRPLLCASVRMAIMAPRRASPPPTACRP